MRVEKMNATVPRMNEIYRQYAELLVQHHRLLREGKEDADETERVEEEMTRLWDGLDQIQRSSLSGLGSDLSWVRRRAVPAPKGRQPAELSNQDSQALATSLKDLDWHAVLHYLRACAPRVPVLEQARIRGSAWTQLGFPKVACIFNEFAGDLEPTPQR